jgi:hypothetical protein
MRPSELVNRGVANCRCPGLVDPVSSVDAATPEVKRAQLAGQQ